MSRRLRILDGRLHALFPFDLQLKDWVKSQGARFDAISKSWSFPLERAGEMVPELLRRGFVADPDVAALVAPAGAGPAADAIDVRDAPAPLPPDSLSVRGLNGRVAEALRDAFPQPLRVVGEVSGYRPRSDSSHVWFDLVERDGGTNEVARVAAVLFASVRSRVERRMRDAGVELADGVRVLLIVRVDFFQRDGRFQILVDDIDPTWTVGDLVGRRDAVIQALAAEGLLERNRALPMPTLPLRIALLTSRESDAYHDVVSVLRASGYAFRVAVFDIRVQGAEVESTVLSQLALVASNRSRFDICLITRGGGSRVELGAFDNANIGRAVARLPLKVIVAIGHQQDTTALDSLAESRRTPTDAAKSLVEHLLRAEQDAETVFADIAETARGALRDAADRLGRMGRRLDQRSRGRLRKERDRVERDAVLRIRAATSRRLQRAASRVARAGALLSPARLRRSLRAADRASLLLAERIGRAAQARVARESAALQRASTQLLKAPRAPLRRAGERLAAAAMRTRLLDPARVLARGYAIVSSSEGGALTSVAAVQVGAQLHVRLRDGSLGVEVHGVHHDEVSDDAER